MKKIFCFILFLLLLIAINCTFCSCDKDEIYINGNVEETLEIYNDFNDPGVSFPNSCTLVIEGNIDNTTLGRQHIIYYVYAESGELLKELHRYVNVVDSTAPTYLENETADSISFYIGKTYTISDFIVEYEDNYDSKNNISVSCTEFIFDKMGDVQIDIDFTDKAGNTSSFSKVITVVADTTPPSFVESADINNQEFYVGMRYDVDCFIADYYDNYASKEEIMVAPSYITFEETGTQPVNIEFTDTFGNKSTYSKTVIVKPIDFALLIQEVEK